MSLLAGPGARTLLLFSLALQAPLAGASGLGVHGQSVRSPRALHTRLALADAVAIATVDQVEVGRIRVRDAAPLKGRPAETFELKRAPSRPPPLTAGDRALLLLRGARPPYLLVDAAHETIALADAAAETRWQRAVSDVLAVQGRPEPLLALYLVWLAGPADDLREVALAGLGDPDAPFQPLPASALAPVVELAVAADSDEALRRNAAGIALGSDAGRRALLARLPDTSGDLVLLNHALRVGRVAEVPEFRPALVRTLRHPDPAIRRVAFGFGGATWRDPALRSELLRLADGDPDPDLRSQAQRALDWKPAEAAGPSRASDGANP